VGASASVYLLDTAKDAFDIILQVGAGTGLLYLLRWFWWRINAWCEIVAMLSSFLVSVSLIFVRRGGVELGVYKELLLVIGVTTVSWLIAAFVAPQTDHATLIAFYRRTHPIGPGWNKI